MSEGDEPGTPIKRAGMTVHDWRRLMFRSNLTKAERFAALTIASFANPDGTNVYPGNKIVSLAMGYGKSDYAGPFVKSLRQKGWIAQTAFANARRGKSATYELSVPNDDSQIVRGPDWMREIDK